MVVVPLLFCLSTVYRAVGRRYDMHLQGLKPVPNAVRFSFSE